MQLFCHAGASTLCSGAEAPSWPSVLDSFTPHRTPHTHHVCARAPAYTQGDFESEIEEMLAASRSKSRLVSPFQSRDFGAESEQGGSETVTPYSLSTRVSLAGVHPVSQSPPTGNLLEAVATAAAAVALERPLSVDVASSSGTHTPAAIDTDAESVGVASSTAALLEPVAPSKEEMAEEIAEATARVRLEVHLLSQCCCC